MFTGIVEAKGRIEKVKQSGEKTTWTVYSPFTHELIIGQSVSHNGVCLTVETIEKQNYTVTMIPETLTRSALSDLKNGSEVNLERSVTPATRLDGHIVQGHVDTIGIIKEMDQQPGQTIVSVSHSNEFDDLVVEKGSICIDGISLTVSATKPGMLSVCLIPHTISVTIASTWSENSRVNLEFDILGKYAKKWLDQRAK